MHTNYYSGSRREVKIAKKVTYWLFISCLPVLLITSTLRWEINELRLYEYGFDKYHISQATGIDRLELKRVAQHLIDYFNTKVDAVQVTVAKDGEEFNLFNERELIHLRDVRSLIQLDHRVQVIALSLIVICVFVLLFWLRVGWRILVRGLLWGGVITLGLVIALVLWALLGFEQFFILFHLVSFSNEYWILDPARDYLIRLFPEGFFYDAALFGFVAVMLEGMLVSGISFGILRLMGRAKGAK